MKRAILYAGVSSTLQAEGFSLQTQIAACRKYAEQHEFAVVAEFQDSITGTTLDRPGLDDARRMINQGEADVLVVFSTDRLSRSLIDFLILRRELELLGIEWHTTNRGLAGNTIGAKALENVEALFAEMERMGIIERTSRGRREKVAMHLVLGTGAPPYGYRYVGERKEIGFEIVPEEAEIVRMVFQWYVHGDESGSVSTIKIALRLTEMGISSPGMRFNWARKRAANCWSTNAIYRLLRVSTYAGRFAYQRQRQTEDLLGKRRIERPQEEWIEVDIPAIIDQELWEAAQRKLDKGRKLSVRKAIHQYLLGRRIRCKCGYGVHGTPYGSKRRLVYVCNARHRAVDRQWKCPLPAFSVEEVDAVVWAWVTDKMLDPEKLAAGIQELDEQNGKQQAQQVRTKAALVKERDDVQEQLNRLLDLYIAGSFDKDMLDTKRGKLDLMHKALNKEIAALDAMTSVGPPTEEEIYCLKNFASTIRVGLDNCDFDTKRRIVDLLNVEATLAVEEGQKVVYVSTLLQSSAAPLPVGILHQSIYTSLTPPAPSDHGRVAFAYLPRLRLLAPVQHRR